MESRHRRDLAEPTDTTTTLEPRNFLVTFLLTCSFGPIGLRHFYLGNSLLGWIRTGLFVGGFVWLIICLLIHQPALAFLGFTGTIAAVIWAVGDFFYVYFKVRSDADGRALAITDRDKRWAKGIFIAIIVLFIFSVILNNIGATFSRNSLHRSPSNTYRIY